MVKAGALPKWTLKITNVLLKLGLHFFINDKRKSIEILNVPKQLFDIILQQTHPLGLIFEVHEERVAMYEGYFRGEKNFAGYQGGSISFHIRDAPEGCDTTEVQYTLSAKT